MLLEELVHHVEIRPARDPIAHVAYGLRGYNVGVVAECESISLSRDVPFGLGAIAGPIIRSTARESMTRTLESLREMVKHN